MPTWQTRSLTRTALTISGPSSMRQRQRLLDVDVLAGVGRVDGDLRVPVIGRGDQHRIEVLLLEQLAVVAVAARVRGAFCCASSSATP